VETLCNGIVDGGWRESLERNNYTHLKITGLDRLQQAVNASGRVGELVEMCVGSEAADFWLNSPKASGLCCFCHSEV
jgi:hypothetical protein